MTSRTHHGEALQSFIHLLCYPCSMHCMHCTAAGTCARDGKQDYRRHPRLTLYVPQLGGTLTFLTCETREIADCLDLARLYSAEQRQRRLRSGKVDRSVIVRATGGGSFQYARAFADAGVLLDRRDELACLVGGERHMRPGPPDGPTLILCSAHRHTCWCRMVDRHARVCSGGYSHKCAWPACSFSSRAGGFTGVSFLLRYCDGEAFTVESSLGPARAKPSDGMQTFQKHFLPADPGARYPYLYVNPFPLHTPSLTPSLMDSGRVPSLCAAGWSTSARACRSWR